MHTGEEQHQRGFCIFVGKVERLQYTSFNIVTNHRRNQFYALVKSVDLKTCKYTANIIGHLLMQLLYKIFFPLGCLSSIMEQQLTAQFWSL